jgi:hypothetical protein
MVKRKSKAHPDLKGRREEPLYVIDKDVNPLPTNCGLTVVRQQHSASANDPQNYLANFLKSFLFQNFRCCKKLNLAISLLPESQDIVSGPSRHFSRCLERRPK